MSQQTIPMALTFDDVLLVPGASEVLPSQVSLKTRLTDTIELQSPLLSAATIARWLSSRCRRLRFLLMTKASGSSAPLQCLKTAKTLRSVTPPKKQRM